MSLQQPCVWRHWPRSGQMVQIPVRAAAFAPRSVPTILPWQSGGRSAPDLCRWPQNGAWLLVDFTCPLLAMECPSSESSLLSRCHTMTRLPALAPVLARVPTLGRGIGHHDSWPGTCHIRAACSSWVSVLPWGFPG